MDNINWAAVEAGSSTVAGVEGAEVIVRDVMANYKDYTGYDTFMDQRVVDVVFMVCEHHHSYSDCQPQLVPVYGKDVAFNNKLKTTGDVSFTKTKYGGEYLSVDAGEFGFDLWRIVDGEEIFVDTYYTDVGGKVTASDLESGSYVFREVWTLLWSESPDGGASGAYTAYNLVWKAIYPNRDDDADGLYFEITAQGETVWDVDANDLDDNGNPTVDNVLYCKHHVLWGAGDDFYFSYDYDVEKCGTGNIVTFKDNCDKCFEIQGVKLPSCESRGILWLGCPKGCTGTGIEFGEILKHDIDHAVAIAPGYGEGFVWFTCENCGAAEVRFDKDAWLALEGPDFGDYAATALAPGYGDGYVWVTYNDAVRASGVEYDRDAWLALGGYWFEDPNVDYSYTALACAPGYGEGMVWVEWNDGRIAVVYDPEAWMSEELGGYELKYSNDQGYYTPVAIASGYGNGYVWIVYCGTDTSDVVYDKTAWLALGGFDF